MRTPRPTWRRWRRSSRPPGDSTCPAGPTPTGSRCSTATIRSTSTTLVAVTRAVTPSSCSAHSGSRTPGICSPGRGVPYIDVGNGGSGVDYPKTVLAAVDGIRGVDTVIPGHSPVMSWADFREFGEFNRDFLTAVERGKTEGKSASEAAASLNLPAPLRELRNEPRDADQRREQRREDLRRAQPLIQHHLVSNLLRSSTFHIRGACSGIDDRGSNSLRATGTRASRAFFWEPVVLPHLNLAVLDKQESRDAVVSILLRAFSVPVAPSCHPHVSATWCTATRFKRISFGAVMSSPLTNSLWPS